MTLIHQTAALCTISHLDDSSRFVLKLKDNSRKKEEDKTKEKQEEQAEKMERFVNFTKDAKELEKQINSMIKEFEKKHGLSCWLSNKKSNQINIDISIDSDKL